jgi:hypothetical protein
MRVPGAPSLPCVLLMALLMGCTTPVPPTVTQPPLEPLSADAEIVVVAVRQNEQVKQSLRDAGFRLRHEPRARLLCSQQRELISRRKPARAQPARSHRW